MSAALVTAEEALCHDNCMSRPVVSSRRHSEQVPTCKLHAIGEVYGVPHSASQCSVLSG